MGEQWWTRPFGCASCAFARDAAEAVKKENVLTVNIVRDDFLQAIDDLKAERTALFQSGQMERGEIAIEAEKDLIQYEKYIDQPRKIYLYFSFTNIHFFSGNYKLANRALNKIIKTNALKETESLLIALSILLIS